MRSSSARRRPAFAGAWTLPQGTGQLIETLYGWTGFGPPWGGNPPANQSRFDAQTYVQYGLNKHPHSLWRDSVRTLCDRAADAEHIQWPRLFRSGPEAEALVDGRMDISGEATAFIPGAHDFKATAQEGNTGWWARRASNAGRNFAIYGVPGFLDAEVAYRLRTEGPPDEWHGDFTVGFKFTPKIMLMLQDYTTVSMSTHQSHVPGLALVSGGGERRLCA